MSLKGVSEYASSLIASFSKEPWKEKWEKGVAEEHLSAYLLNPYCLGIEARDKETKKLCGVIIGELIPFYDGTHLNLVELYVDPSYDHQGIGSLLLREIESVSREKHGVKVIELWTSRAEKTMKFYAKNGYKEDKDNLRLIKVIG